MREVIEILLGAGAVGFGAWRRERHIRWASWGLAGGLVGSVLIESVGVPSDMLGPNSAWFWTMLQFFVVAVSLLFISRQVSLQRQGTMLASLDSMSRRWQAREMRECRRAVCSRSTNPETGIGWVEEEILLFFEELGLHLHRGVFEEAVVWELYSYQIEHYWPMFRQRVEAFRKESGDTSYFDHFQALHESMANYSRTRGIEPREVDEAALERFCRGELQRVPPQLPSVGADETP